MRNLRQFSTACSLLALVVLVFGVAACAGGAQEPAIPRGAGIGSWYENGTGGRYVVLVKEGSLKSLAMGSHTATVLSDANCTPDGGGLSHCYNAIRLDDGSQLTIQDNHQMSRHRCLEQGETVRVSELSGRWVTLQTAQ